MKRTILFTLIVVVFSLIGCKDPNKEIYDGIYGKCDDWIIGYAGQENPFTWNQFVELLKECYDNKSDLIWE